MCQIVSLRRRLTDRSDEFGDSVILHDRLAQVTQPVSGFASPGEEIEFLIWGIICLNDRRFPASIEKISIFWNASKPDLPPSVSLLIGNNDVFDPDIFKSPASRILTLARRSSEMKKLTTIVMALLTVGIYADFATAQEDAPRRPGAEREGDAPRRPGTDGERRPGGFMARLPIFAAIDEDKDGILSEKEIANATAALKTLDKNKDGKLDEEELRPDFGNRGPRGPGAEGGARPRRPGAEGGDRPRRPGAEGAAEGDRPRRPATTDNN